MEETINAANELYLIFDDDPPPAVKGAFQRLVGDLAMMINDSAELSVFARRFLATHRSKAWIDHLYAIA